jgi:hypothetical protein
MHRAGAYGMTHSSIERIKRTDLKKKGQILFSPILIKKIKYKKNPRSDHAWVGRDVTPPMAADDPILHHPVNGTHEFPADMWTAPNVPSLARRPWL